MQCQQAYLTQMKAMNKKKKNGGMLQAWQSGGPPTLSDVSGWSQL